jgi:two-component system, cell cycle sensor histidine kinase and response regulator CckA
MREQEFAPHVVVAEDEPMQALKLEGLLQSIGCRVRIACNGREALAMLQEEPTDLLISDVMMPEIDGYELCRRIRASQTLKGLRVILLTSLSDPRDVIRGLEAGADNFLEKPYETSGLLQMVRDIIERKDAPEGDRAEVYFKGAAYVVHSTRNQIMNFFMTLYQDLVQKNEELARMQKELRYFNENLTHLVDQRTAALSQEVAFRKKAEDESRDRAQLLDKAQDAILVTELDGTILYFNPSARNLYRWPEAELIGKKIFSLLYDDKRPFPHEALAAVMSKGEWVGELHQVTMGETEVVVMSSWTLVRDNHERPRAILYINTDLTDRKKLEAQFLRAQRLESIGILAGGIAHDLNNLMAPVLLGADLLRTGITEPMLLKTVGLIESSAKRAVGIVKQVLTFTRGSGDERVLVQVKHVMKETYQIVQELLPLSMKMDLDYARDLMPVMGDPTQLHQVLMNLCVNARDAMPQGGRISLNAQNVQIDETFASMHAEAKVGPYILVTVKDTGTGIPRELQSKIFEPFFTTKEVGKGTGLGLSTVLSIVERHGGFVLLESEPGVGTEFSIYLPAVQDAAETDTQVQDPGTLHGNGETILFVDDEKVVREMATLTLEGFGYNVITASDGTEAIAEYARAHGAIAAVVVDLAMPYLDGTSTIRALRKLNPAVHVIAISGNDDAILKARAVLDSTLPILRKPFTGEKLLRYLHNMLGGSFEM